MKTSPEGINLIKRFEGFSPVAYYATEEEKRQGKQTIGYGHVIKEGEAFREPMTEPQAVELLKKDISWAENAVREKVKENVPLSQHQFDALVSFVFNLGAGALGSSTLLNRLNSGQHERCVGEFGRWVYQRGKGNRLTPLAGLVKRRAAEALMWMESA